MSLCSWEIDPSAFIQFFCPLHPHPEEMMSTTFERPADDQRCEWVKAWARSLKVDHSTNGQLWIDDLPVVFSIQNWRNCYENLV